MHVGTKVCVQVCMYVGTKVGMYVGTEESLFNLTIPLEHFDFPITGY